MKIKYRKSGTILILALLAVIVTTFAYAYLSDSKQVSVTMKAATLKLGEVVTVPANIGNNLKPGDSDTLTVKVQNIGTIPGKYTVKLSNIPGFLTFDNITKSGQVGAGETVLVPFHWSIPLDADMGAGGQEIDLKVSVNLEQIP